MLFITAEREIHVWPDVLLAAGHSRWKDHTGVEFTFTSFLNRELTASNLPFYVASMTLIIFVNLSRLILKKGGFTTVLVNHKKESFH